jgi:hypothetical protein
MVAAQVADPAPAGPADSEPAVADASSTPIAALSPSTAAVLAVTVQRASRPAGSGAATLESRAHGAREVRRKPKTARPQPRTAAETTPSSPTPTEDLYDTR